MLAVHLILLVALLPLVALPSYSSGKCDRSCGNQTDAVPYPLGFSHGCRVLLSCSADGGPAPPLRIGGFSVRSVNATKQSLLVDVPLSCNRTIREVDVLFGKSFGVTANNTLLLGNCSSNSNGSVCLVSSLMMNHRLGAPSCKPSGEKISCFPTEASPINRGGQRPSLLAPAFVKGIDCLNFFSSVAIGGDRTPDFASLELGTVELGWWVEGDCSLCHHNASCSLVDKDVIGAGTSSQSVKGVECSCKEGFMGDGFNEGSGCYKERTQVCNSSKYNSHRCRGTTRIAILIGGVVAGAVSMAALGLLCYFIQRRSTLSKMKRSTKRLLSEASCTIPLYPFKEIERATNGFAEENRLGTGAYGTVYVGKLHNNELVAVKRIRHRDTDGIEQVINEIKLLSSVSHPNLVRLLGCCIDRGEQILVYEYMANGTLSQHLQRESCRPGLPWTVRLTIAADTAKAIAHLHSAIYPPIYHRDIKSSNILLDYNFSSKVADFGLSRMIVTESSHISTAPQGTPGYLDPQYHQNFHLSDKSDVYSFGVVLVEIITAMKVVDFNRAQSEVNLAALAVDKIGKGCVEDIVDPSLEPNRDAWTLSSINKVAELAFRCLAFHRDMRPSMKEVADELEQIRLSGWVPPDEDILSPSPSESSRGAVKSRRFSGTAAMEEIKVESPVSVVQGLWYSEQSPPSTNSLLGHAIR